MAHPKSQRFQLLPFALATLLSLLGLMVPCSSVLSQTAPHVLDIQGDIPTPGSLSLAELQALGAVTAAFTQHGQAHQIVGVPLFKVLTRAGFTPGPMGKSVPTGEKRSGYRKVVVASAPDGFQGVFSTAELSESIGKSQVLIVWAMDGKALPADSGPLRLVSLTDSEGSRSIYQLRRLDIVDLRRVLARSPEASKASGR